MNSKRPRIVVVGSLNADHTMRVPRLPKAGETRAASGAFTCFGGKGANQALAAARAGGDVSMIGCVGEDDFGSRYLAHLQAEGIDTKGVARSATPTGSAFIAVDDAGENLIIVNAGANHAITTQDVEAAAEVISKADALLLQLECPLAVVKRAAEIAHDAGVRVILNPSPWIDGWKDAGIPIDVLIVNAHEATTLMGGKRRDPKPALPLLVVTRGSDSTLAYSRAEGVVEVHPPKVVPVDTVGAGDTFAGALAVALTEGGELRDAIAFANAAGALSTIKAGAQPSIPHRSEIVAKMK